MSLSNTNTTPTLSLEFKTDFWSLKAHHEKWVNFFDSDGGESIKSLKDALIQVCIDADEQNKCEITKLSEAINNAYEGRNNLGDRAVGHIEKLRKRFVFHKELLKELKTDVIPSFEKCIRHKTLTYNSDYQKSETKRVFSILVNDATDAIDEVFVKHQEWLTLANYTLDGLKKRENELSKPLSQIEATLEKIEKWAARKNVKIPDERPNFTLLADMEDLQEELQKEELHKEELQQEQPQSLNLKVKEDPYGVNGLLQVQMDVYDEKANKIVKKSFADLLKMSHDPNSLLDEVTADYELYQANNESIDNSYIKELAAGYQKRLDAFRAAFNKAGELVVILKAKLDEHLLKANNPVQEICKVFSVLKDPNCEKHVQTIVLTALSLYSKHNKETLPNLEKLKTDINLRTIRYKKWMRSEPKTLLDDIQWNIDRLKEIGKKSRPLILKEKFKNYWK